LRLSRRCKLRTLAAIDGGEAEWLIKGALGYWPRLNVTCGST
jgi:hypothetical protein